MHVSVILLVHSSADGHLGFSPHVLAIVTNPAAINICVQGFCMDRFFLILLTYLFLAALGLGCCTQAFPSCGEWGRSLVSAHRLLTAVDSLVAKLTSAAQA